LLLGPAISTAAGNEIRFFEGYEMGEMFETIYMELAEYDRDLISYRHENTELSVREMITETQAHLRKTMGLLNTIIGLDRQRASKLYK
jgi:hypothetical protein